MARLVKYGETVKATGYRKELFAASLPNCESEKCCMIISSIFNMKCYPMPCYLNLTLTPSNPILHTVRLRNLFDDYKEGKFYSSVPLFYEGWNDETSKMIFNCDDEVQNICSKLDKFDLSFVKSLKVHYESGTPEALTNKIQSILGFKGLKSPTKETPFGYIPDFESRYFTADFPFGLSILIQIADIVGVNVPYMRDTMNWYRSVIQNYKEFSYKRYGISSHEDFINFYSL